MTVFDYPRVNFSGTLTLNPATANNCDYANAFVLPPGLGARVGQALGLIDSKLVRAITYGMDDETFRAWVQKAQTFNSVGNDPQPAQIVPAEWNYYGDLGTSLKAQVVGVTTGPGTTYTEPESGVSATGPPWGPPSTSPAGTSPMSTPRGLLRPPSSSSTR